MTQQQVQVVKLALLFVSCWNTGCTYSKVQEQ